MNKLIPFVARQPFEHAGVQYAQGEQGELTAAPFLTLLGQKLIGLGKRVKRVVEPPAPKKRTYRRKDLRPDHTVDLHAD